MKLLLVGTKDFKVGDKVVNRRTDSTKWITTTITIVAVDEAGWVANTSPAHYLHSNYVNYEFEVEREAGTLELSTNELVVGDIVSEAWISGHGWIPYTRTVIKVDDVFVYWSSGGTDRRMNGFKFRVTRSAPTPAKSGRWNGTCRCGKGTYVGFLQIEHDGPCQLAR